MNAKHGYYLNLGKIDDHSSCRMKWEELILFKLLCDGIEIHPDWKNGRKYVTPVKERDEMGGWGFPFRDRLGGHFLILQLLSSRLKWSQNPWLCFVFWVGESDSAKVKRKRRKKILHPKPEKNNGKLKWAWISHRWKNLWYKTEQNEIWKGK